MSFRERLARFFYGRNGMDKFNRFLFSIYVVIMLCSWIISLFSPFVTFFILSPLSLLLALYMTFRCFSRNIYKRQAENRKYMALRDKIRGFFTLQKNRIKERKTHIYKKCPYCRAVLRLKRIKGNHRAVCPRCTKSFDLKVR